MWFETRLFPSESNLSEKVSEESLDMKLPTTKRVCEHSKRKKMRTNGTCPMVRTYVNADAVLAQSADRMATRPKYMVLKYQMN